MEGNRKRMKEINPCNFYLSFLRIKKALSWIQGYFEQAFDYGLS